MMRSPRTEQPNKGRVAEAATPTYGTALPGGAPCRAEQRLSLQALRRVLATSAVSAGFAALAAHLEALQAARLAACWKTLMAARQLLAAPPPRLLPLAAVAVIAAARAATSVAARAESALPGAAAWPQAADRCCKRADYGIWSPMLL